MVANHDVTADDAGIEYAHRIQQGNTQTTRVGNRIVVTNISVRGEFKYTTNDTGGCWVYLVLDKQANGAAPKWKDIFHENAGVNVGPAYLGYNQMYTNPNNETRFQILKSWLLGYGNYSGVANGMASKFFSCDLRTNIEVKYTGSSQNASIADVGSNAIYLLAGHNSDAAQGFANCSANVRLRYTDV